MRTTVSSVPLDVAELRLVSLIRTIVRRSHPVGCGGALLHFALSCRLEEGQALVSLLIQSGGNSQMPSILSTRCTAQGTVAEIQTDHRLAEQEFHQERQSRMRGRPQRRQQTSCSRSMHSCCDRRNRENRGPS